MRWRRGVSGLYPCVPFLMLRALLTAVLLLLAATPAVAMEVVRIATCNVHCGNRRFDAIAAAVSQSRAAIVCLQETTPQMERELRSRLQRQYSVFHATGHKGTIPAERFALLATKELHNVRFVPPRAGLFGFYEAEFRAGNATARIINVHLTPFLPPRNGGVLQGMSALAETEETHADEIADILASYDPQQPTVVIGDFNSLSPSKAPQALATAGFVDAAAALHDDADTLATWHFSSPRMRLRLRIDYVFHTQHFAPRSVKIIPAPGSDHALVVAELELSTEINK